MHKIQQWKWPTVQKHPFFKLCHGSRLSAKPLLHFHFYRVGAPEPQPWQSCFKGERHPSRLKADSVHPQIKTAGEHLKLHVGQVWGVCATWGYKGEGVKSLRPTPHTARWVSVFQLVRWVRFCNRNESHNANLWGWQYRTVSTSVVGIRKWSMW